MTGNEYLSGNGGKWDEMIKKELRGNTPLTSFLCFCLFLICSLSRCGKGVRRRAFAVKKADFDIVVYSFTYATGLVIFNDAGHGSRVEGDDIGRGEMKGVSREGVERRQRGIYHEKCEGNH
jgi:hypothetical protein